jgi:hypothetical protein
MAEHGTIRISAPKPNTAASAVPRRILQRKCACAGFAAECERCAQPLRLQRRSTSDDRGPIGDAPPIVHDVLASPGRPLDSQTRSFMEPRFGRSFADVRVHTDEQAAASARAVHAHAYTVGNNIAFASNAYALHSSTGRRLLAHELAHVVQQSSHGPEPGLMHEHEADRAADGVLAGHDVRIGRTASTAVQRQEAPAAEEPVPSYIGNRAVAFITDMLPLGTTARIASAALSGLTTGAIKELKGGGKGAVLFKAIKGFKAKNIPEVMVGYTAGAIQGVVSPITDLFSLAQFVEHMGRLAVNFLSGPLAKHKDLVDDIKNLLPTSASLTTALSTSFAKFKEHPLDTIGAIMAAPFNMSVAAEKKAFQFGAQHGREMIDSMVEPVDAEKKKPEAPSAPKSKGFLDRIAETFSAGHDAVINVAWAKMGEKVGYAVGWAVINAAMLIFSEGIGNALVEGAAALGEFSKTLGVFARVVEGISDVMAGVGKAIAAVEKLVNMVMGALLKPLEPILKPFLGPFGDFLKGLQGFLRKLFGVAEKEAAPVAKAATAGAAAIADDAAKIVHPPPVRPPTAHAPATGSPTTHPPTTHVTTEPIPTAQAPTAEPSARPPAREAAEPAHPSQVEPAPVEGPHRGEPVAPQPSPGRETPGAASAREHPEKAPATPEPGKVLAEKPAADGHHVQVTPEGIEQCSAPPCPILRRMYQRELADNPILGERLDHAERIRFLDPEGSAELAAEIQKDLVKLRKAAGPGARQRVTPYERELGTQPGAEEAAARRELEADVNKRLPEGSRTATVRTERSEAGRAQNRAAAREGEIVDPEIEYRIDLPDNVRQRAGLPARSSNAPTKGTFKPDDIKFYGKEGENYLFIDHKHVGTVWEDSFYSSAAARPKIRAMLERDLRIGEALQPRCKGFAYTTDDPNLAKLLTEEIIEMRIRFPAAKDLLHAP